MSGQAIFRHATEGEWTDLGGGSWRRVLLHTEELMLVEFGFEAGAIGALHSHPHVQASYVAAGRFEVTVGEADDVHARAVPGARRVDPRRAQRRLQREHVE